MNKLLTTALVSAILAVPSFADGNGTVVAESGAKITVASKAFTSGVDTVEIQSGGTLSFDVEGANIDQEDKLILADGATVNLNNHTVNNKGTITIEYGTAGLTLGENANGTGIIKQAYSGSAATSHIIIKGTENSDITSVKLIGAGTGGITVTENSNSDTYRGYLTTGGSSLAATYGTDKDGTISDLSVSPSTSIALKINGNDYTIDNRPEIQYADDEDNITKLSTTLSDTTITNSTSSTLLSDFGITFQNNNGEGVSLETDAGTNGSIDGLTDASGLIVIPANTSVDLGTQSDDVTVNADITNISGCDQGTLTYAEGITIKGTFTDANLILEGDLSELHEVNISCDIKIAGSTVPGGTLGTGKTMTISNDADLKSDLDASAGKLSVEQGKTLTVCGGNTLTL